ncbi:hypothetical protein MKK67_25860 [Methylobacterium sp. J-072]|uniref:hypothetical protein n=1 Tax=Methylobacterium sp. J-072 TaxID=2836651 RepID=UPI001FB929F4|nr:hypothetical protein [Methylobacterium sp. J-072]MCJ2095897.1 hypothetical protein [Methylobacterium sp. J-072]
MSADTEKHRALLGALKDAQGKGNGSCEKAVTAAFEHVFEHLGHLNDHVARGGPERGQERGKPQLVQNHPAK